MYVAELKGKLSSKVEHKEDILTSYVFSFFKYSDRKTFLKPFLNELGFKINNEDADDAEFIFWPCYEDGTEPDVVLIVGNYYILFEAKYFSDFGDDQLTREAEGGRLKARNAGKQFHLVAVTADYNEPIEKFYKIRAKANFQWINWQFITLFLEKKLQEAVPDRQFAEDLYSLLKKKNLRIYNGFFNLFLKKPISECRLAFFDYISAKHRGSFIGFLEAFAYWRYEIEKHKTLFFEIYKEFYWEIPKEGFVKINKKLFFGG